MTNRSKPSAQSPDDLQILLGEQSFPVRLRKIARARSIAVSADTVKREVRLTMPLYASTKQALRFAQSKSDWLEKCFTEALPAVPIVNGTQIAVEGETHTVRWSPDHARKPVKVNCEIHVGGPESRIEDRIISWLKEKARSVYAEDLAFYCQATGKDLPKLSVGDARRRWGSCSGQQSIRMNWRLIMAPRAVRRSVVAHEVAHLTHMNHSAAFYDLLDSIFEGDRAAADLWLKQHGSALHLIGA